MLTNIPNPYNVHLFDVMWSHDDLLCVDYQTTPASYGRPWAADPRQYESTVPGPLQSALRARRVSSASDAVIVSGNYRRARDVLRIAAARSGSDKVLFWGERLRDGGPLVQRYRSSIMRRFDAVLAIGTWAVPSYRAVLPHDACLHVLPYTTTMHRRRRGELGDVPTFGFVGSLIERKGLDIVLEAVAGMPSRRRPVLEVAGSGPLREALAATAAEAGVQVVWLGELDQAAIDERRSTWWAQVVPSRYDGWGAVVSEALASGVPVLASTSTGAALDLVRDGFSGRLVPTDSAWADVLRDYCALDRVLREGRGAQLIGQAASSEAAAPFLAAVAREPLRPRNFIAEAWARVSAEA